MTARIHHYVPQLYLKGFCRDPKCEQLFVIDGVEKRAFTTRPRNVAAERDFNRVDLEGVPPDALEVAFNAFETEAAAAIERTRQRRHFRDAEDRSVILNLIGLMAIRNPRWRGKMKDFHQEVMMRMMQTALATPERWASQVARAKAAGYIDPDADADAHYETIKARVDGGHYRFQFPREKHIALELSTFDKLLPFLFHREWTLLRAQSDTGCFKTSDHPVCLTWTDRELHGGFYPPGFGVGKTAVLVPLTSDLALLGTFEGHGQEYDADIIAVAECNAMIIGYAERQVYAAEPDFPYLRQAPVPFARGDELLAHGEFDRPRPKQGKTN
jgi:Protein of unknown function (DUF4238)